MSPFEEMTDHIAHRIRLLALPAQVALYAAAGRALTPSYLDWSQAVGQEPANTVLDLAIRSAQRFAMESAREIEPVVLDAIEAATPSEPTDSHLFTAAQDCWICVDTAVRASLGEFDPADSAWYLLEPMFQATSERLFGLADVGSEGQREAELTALRDVGLAAAVTAIETAISTLEEGALDNTRLELLRRILEPMAPR